LNGKNLNDLLWAGREPDPTFLPNEQLFLRVPQFNQNGSVDAAHVRFPDTSVNRGKYSEPEHLLMACGGRFKDDKVAVFYVRDIPNETATGDGRRIDIRIAHDPVRPPEEAEENYAHSEIRSFENGVRCSSISKPAAKFVRIWMAERMTRAL
jgi:hypothetical protein